MIGRYERFKKNIKESVEFDIDFSELKIDGYVYYKSTYIQGGIIKFSNRILSKKGRISSLITQENMQLISKLIPVYNDNEKIVRILKWIMDGNWSVENMTDSILYQTYCNGFTTGYKEIDKRISQLTDQMMSVSNIECNNYIDRFVKLHDYSVIPTQDKNLLYFWEYFIELGKREGATVRGLLYTKELHVELETKNTGRNKQEEKRLLRNIINLDEQLKEDLWQKILIEISNNGNVENVKGKAIGLLYIALSELEFINIKSQPLIKPGTFLHIIHNTFPYLEFEDSGFYNYTQRNNLKLNLIALHSLNDLKNRLKVIK